MISFNLDLRKRRELEKQKAAREKVAGLMGQAQAPYQMGEEELFPGEIQEEAISSGMPIGTPAGQAPPGLMTKGTGYLGSIQDPRQLAEAKLYGGMVSIPAYEKIGAQGLMDVQRRAGVSSAQKPTTLMQNLSAAGFEQGTPDYQQAVKDYLTKSGTTINMGAKNITAQDAQQMRNDKDEMPPIGMNWKEAGDAGFRFINKQEETKAGEHQEMIGSMQQSFDTYKDILTKQGVMAPWKMMTDPENYNKLTAAYAQLQLEFKELAKLGVLTGPDMGLIESVMQDPTSIRSNAAAYYSGKNPLINQLGIVGDKLATARKRAAERYGKNWRQKKRGLLDMSDAELRAIAGQQ